MKRIPALIAAVKAHWLRTAVVLALAVLAVWFFFFRSTAAPLQTLTVHRGDFIEQVAVAGTVEAAQNVNLGFAQSGRVSGVYARVGDRVAAGALLAEIENGDLRATVLQKQAALENAQAKLQSLQEGTRPEELAVTQSKVESDEVALAQANLALLNAIQNAYTAADSAVLDKVDQFITNPRSATPQLAFSVSDSNSEAAVESGRVTVEGALAAWRAQVNALAASSDLAAASQQSLANLSTVALFLSDVSSALARAVPTSAVSQATINTYISDIATARTNVNTAASSLTTAQTAATAAATALATERKNLALEQAGSTPADLAAQEANVAAAQADLTSAQASLRKTLVVAPFSGVVTRMDAKAGEISSPTVSDISMISSGVFQITTYVPEVSIAQVAVGNLASTTLDAYDPDTNFDAKVIAIDPAETVREGVSTYKVTLEFSAADPRIRSGMTASVNITTKDIPDTIAIPQGAVFQKNGKNLVQVMEGDTAVEKAVELGATSGLGQVQILSGLEDGDVVVLNPSP